MVHFREMIVATYISWGNMCKNRSQFSWQSQFCCLQEWAIPCCFFFRMMNGCFFPEMNGRAHPMHFFLERCQYQAHRFDKKAQFWKKYTNDFNYCIKILLIIIFVVVELAFWICIAASVQTNVAIPFRSFSNLLWVFILSSWDFSYLHISSPPTPSYIFMGT